MQTTTIDGVTTFWEPTPGPLTGMLIFRVGARHETFRTAQVTHMVEHLVMSTMPKSHLDSNARVDADTTTFHATGQPEEVSAFLARVCAALRDLPLGRIEREAGVLQAEEGRPEHPAICWAVAARYDFTGVGLLGTAGPGPEHLTAAQVSDFARTHFVRDNAVLVLTGEPPAGLRLDLPEGAQPPVPTSRRSAMALPALVRDDMPIPTLSVELPGGTDHRSLLQGVFRERLTDDLRHGRGIAYDCGVALLRLDDSSLMAAWAEGIEAKRDVIASALWDTFRSLAEDGPTQQELDHEVAGAQVAIHDPRNTLDWLAGQAWRHLNGHPIRAKEEQLTRMRAVTPQMVQGWAQEALPSAVFGLPRGVQVNLPGLPDRTEEDRPQDDPVAGETFRRKPLAIAPLDLRVVAGAEGITQTAKGFTVGGSWEEVVGVAVADGIRELVLVTGQTLLLSRRHLKDTSRLFAIVDERAGDRRFDSTEDEILTG